MKKTYFVLLTLITIFSSTIFAQWREIITSASDRENNDRYGSSVAISGKYAIIGASGDDFSTGAAYILKNENGTWSEVQKIVASDGTQNDSYGSSVAISGNYAVVGAPYSNTSRGTIYIYENQDGTWIELDRSRGRTVDSFFGISVAISENDIFVGVGSCCGTVTVLRENSGVWNFIQRLTPSGARDNDYFGSSVSISNDYAIIGARGIRERKPGQAFIFKKTNGFWREVQRLRASDYSLNNHANFGNSVSISDNYAIVGAYNSNVYNRENSGAAYIFKNERGIWREIKRITSSSPFGNTHFGKSVSISGTQAIVGEPEASDESQRWQGFFATMYGATTQCFMSGGIWIRGQKFFGLYEDPLSSVGNSVAISGNYAIAGAFMQDILSRIPLISHEDAGVAYIFNHPSRLTVIFSSLKVVTRKNTATFTWSTRREVNNYGFEIEATTSSLSNSNSGKPLTSPKVIWKKIGFVKGNGNTNSLKNYTYRYMGGVGYKFYRLKQISTDGNTEYSNIVSVSKSKNNPLGKTKLFKNYPNPFNPSTQISFTLADAGNVNVSVYNALGQKVAELVNGNMNAGTHKVEFNGSNLSSGLYIYRLETPNYSKTMKMLLLK